MKYHSSQERIFQVSESFVLLTSRIWTKTFWINKHKTKEEQIIAGNLSAVLNPATTIIVNFGIIVNFYISGFKINAGSMTMCGEVISLINYMNQILLSMYVFANVIVILNKASTIQKMCRCIKSETRYCPGISEAPSDYQNLITYDHVSFSYYSGNVNWCIIQYPSRSYLIGVIEVQVQVKLHLLTWFLVFMTLLKVKSVSKTFLLKSYKFMILRNMIGIVPQQATLRNNQRKYAMG